MHEMSIVESLLETMRETLTACPHGQVRAVRVRVGALRRVEPLILQFCYEAAVRDTPMAGSRLEIQPVEAGAKCESCGLEFPVEQHWFECPRCHSCRARLMTGDELDLVDIELDVPFAARTCPPQGGDTDTRTDSQGRSRGAL